MAAVRASLGEAGEIETETAALIAEHGLEDAEFPADALADLPQLSAGSGWAQR